MHKKNYLRPKIFKKCRTYFPPSSLFSKKNAQKFSAFFRGFSKQQHNKRLLEENVLLIKSKEPLWKAVEI